MDDQATKLVESVTDRVAGIFEPNERIGGWLRADRTNYRALAKDVIVPSEVSRRCNLRGGEMVVGIAEPNSAANKSKPPRLRDALLIDDLSVDDHLSTKPFEELTAIDPQERIRFETLGGSPSMRVIDLMTPIGLGQRGLIVAPPRTGKTVLLQQMAEGIATNHPNVYMMVLLVDERPEEVTHMQRSVRGEVVHSSNDQDVASHVRIARLVIERAKRLVETGRNVVILLDSLTRVGRAFNAAVRGSGRIMSGGLDIRALTEPKSIFGAARKVEHGGSLTIMASALIDTGSRMDEVIFNEFKGTGNMEIMLSRNMANRRIWPAIDLQASGTRKEERLLTEAELAASHSIRRDLISEGPERAMERLLELMSKYPTNALMLDKLVQKPRR